MDRVIDGEYKIYNPLNHYFKIDITGALIKLVKERNEEPKLTTRNSWLGMSFTKDPKA